MSWDITTDLGSTALAVAAQRAAETAQDDPLIHDEFAAVLVAAANEPGWQRLAGGDLSWMGAEDDVGRRVARTGREYVATRTVFFDEFCADAASSGISQFVILAAGLDARAYRLAPLTGKRVYEIDQPAVQAFKATALTAHGATPLADLCAIPVDLRDERWALMLMEAGWDKSLPTAWLVEGLLPYLSSTEHNALFDTLTALSAPDSRLAAEVYHHSTMHFGDKRLSAWHDGAAEIDDALGVDTDVTAFIKDHDVSDTASWLSQHGWSVDSLDSREKMSRLGRPIPPDLRDIAPASSLVTAIRNGP
ncbi:methyltransferase, putative, family protein [Mycobacterium europaeum]|uniref:S-adenosyl-L-methionine-dependent methyltransferase n=1 Tax=Mycobacterium europaeum TaxID=761804 RepID=A0A0U1DKJ8_9MYCO|nr:class I SAM-dependent methyltransferase [Mycobacterium europaeum]CQD18069.1 methyltransferase, putative, family protein [Mycobacterium europaeum]